ncbi:MAG TPA: methane monooxygenase/ammonia monooxygenase subunit C [Cycloclasticus sp.]|jgi:methane/ammonia monooxygenase subunit C|nr:methane monooxygenase/ammonia monooxygenase subunit C [Cycloclasticus sp.]HIL92729.1 methane monooxygenase/ammonia monooxygenase subunit C [Cycloclasticus sp.]
MSTPSVEMGGDVSKSLVGWKRITVIILSVTVVMAAWRIYQQLFAWDMGMDSFEPEFQTYWMDLLYAQWIIEFTLAAVIWGYILKTRDKDVFNITPQEELRRYFTLLAYLVCYVFIVYWAASFFAEQDASWHQVTVRDTDFTPSHIVLFYGTMPAYILAGVAAFLYARTRLPQFAENISIPFVIAVVGPFMILPNVGLNEWGHTFWFMEELFTAPLHWGFVVLGWTALALGGLLIQIILRLIALTKLDDEVLVTEDMNDDGSSY